MTTIEKTCPVCFITSEEVTAEICGVCGAGQVETYYIEKLNKLNKGLNHDNN